jgi:hypothetical protein
VTPTESPEDICAGFDLLNDFTTRRRYELHDVIPMLIALDSPNALIYFEAVQLSSGEGAGFELPGGQTIGMNFQINALPGPGIYDWTLSVRTAQYGDLCALVGRFTVTRPTLTPRPTLESTEIVEPEE